jgi:hypothetical protein
MAGAAPLAGGSSSWESSCRRIKCNWPRGGAPGPIAIGTREGIGDSGKRAPTLESIEARRRTVGPYSDLFKVKIAKIIGTSKKVCMAKVA